MHPYATPHDLTPGLIRAHDYWEGLRRGDNDVPFWNDLILADLGDLARNAFVIEVFDRPQRFRFASLGHDLARRHHQDVVGKHLDEVTPTAPFQFLLSQCSATVEGAQPTCHTHHFGSANGYARLLQPLWGEGRIRMLLGFVDWS